MPWTTTVYELYPDKLLIRKGLLSISEDEIRLYRITDMTLKRNLWQRLLGLGTIHLYVKGMYVKGMSRGRVP